MQIIEKNILDITEGMVIHQTNCLGIMGGGLALQLREKYPSVYDHYKKFCESRSSRYIMGTVLFSKASDSLVIGNCFGQYAPNTQGRATDFTCLERCLESVATKAEELNLQVYVPFGMSSGLAGGSTDAEREETWKIVQKMLSKHLPNAIICKLTSVPAKVVPKIELPDPKEFAKEILSVQPIKGTPVKDLYEALKPDSTTEEYSLF